MVRLRALTFVFVLVVSVFPLWAQRSGSGSRGGGKPTGGFRNLTNQNTPLPTSSTLQHASDEKDVEFKSQTVLVQVPVIVTDNSGITVPGLSKSDFEIRENGKEEKISTFEEIQARRAPLAASPLPAGEYTNASSLGEAPRAITVIVLDTINTPYLDQTYGRKQLIKYLAENLQPGQPIGLVSITSHGVKVIHNFSSDPAELIQALKKVNGELPAMQGVDTDTQALAGTRGDSLNLANLASPNTAFSLEDFITQADAGLARMQQDRAIEATIKAFLQIAWSLSGIPGKKSLVWATGGFPFFMDTPSAVPGGYLSIVYERTMQAMNDAEISIYPIDVRGLVNYLPVTDASLPSNKSGGSYVQSLSARSWLQTSTIDTLKDFAEMTGGRAFYNTNDLTTSFQRAIDDANHYYLLSYYLDTTNRKPGWRSLKIKVNHPGVQVRARTGFFVTNATVNPDMAHNSDMNFALTSPFESTGVLLTLRWNATSASGAKRKIPFGLYVAPQGITTAGQHNQLNLEVAIVALTSKNAAVADSITETLQGAIKPEMLPNLRQQGLAYNNVLELPAGQYTVRIVVRDNPSGRLGSLTAPLTVN